MSTVKKPDLNSLSAEIKKTKDLVDSMNGREVDATDITLLRFRLSTLIEKAARLLAEQSQPESKRSER